MAEKQGLTRPRLAEPDLDQSGGLFRQALHQGNANLGLVDC